MKIKQCSTVGHVFCGIMSKTRMFCLRKPLKQRQPYRFVALGNETAIGHGHFSGYIYFGGILEAPNKIIRCAFHTQLSLLRFVLFENSVTLVALLRMPLFPSVFFQDAPVASEEKISTATSPHRWLGQLSVKGVESFTSRRWRCMVASVMIQIVLSTSLLNVDPGLINPWAV